MTAVPRDPADLGRAIDEAANALQAAVLISARLTQGLVDTRRDAERLHVALTRAVEALRRLHPPSPQQDR